MATLLLSGAADAVAGEGAVAAARAWREAHGPAILASFADLLAIPNAAADDRGLRRNAERLREELERRSVVAELWELEGAPPIVFGELRVPGARRTLGIYLHYDGQPVDPDAWSRPPWKPTLRTSSVEAGGVVRSLPTVGEAIDPEWRLYARSAGDDKAPVAALLAALDALDAAGLAPAVNLEFLFEGEEEAGSPHLEAFLRTHRERFTADGWVICDGPVHASGRPQLAFGVRGYSGLDLTVYGAVRYLHSGHYGNWAPNPAILLANLLASMKDLDGRVLIEGFYDGTLAPGEAERAAIARLPEYDATLRRELGLAATEMGNAPLAARLLLPSLNVRGMVSGAVGRAARNLIPTRAEASLDIRLAAGNDPRVMLDRVEAHVRRQGFHLVRIEPDAATRQRYGRIVKVVRRPGYPAARTPMDGAFARAVIEAAERVAGEDLVLLPTLGGSLPLYLFGEVLQRPVVIVPIANADDNQHAPDENLRVGNLWYGIDLMASLLALPELAAEPAEGAAPGAS